MATVVLTISISLGIVNPVFARSKFKTVALWTGYGTAGGALLGLSTVPFNGSSRSILWGAAVGFYLGLAAGVYKVSTQEEVQSAGRDPSYPLKPGIELGKHEAYSPALIQTSVFEYRF